MRKIIIPKRNNYLIKKTKINLLCVGDPIIYKGSFFTENTKVFSVYDNKIIVKRYIGVSEFTYKLLKKHIKIDHNKNLYFVFNFDYSQITS